MCQCVDVVQCDVSFTRWAFPRASPQGTERKLTDIVFSNLDATLQYRTASQNTYIDVSLGALYLHDLVTEGTLFPNIIEPVSRYYILAMPHPEFGVKTRLPCRVPGMACLSILAHYLANSSTQCPWGRFRQAALPRAIRFAAIGRKG